MKYKEIINDAKEKKYAIPHFNSNNLEFTKWILEVCNNMNSPVIIGYSEGAIKYMGGAITVASVVKSLIKDLNIHVPVFIHLDHGKSLDMCIECYNAGFDSVMIDASDKSIEENIELTKQVCTMCPGVVESEIGAIAADSFADEAEAIKMIKACDISFLAVAVGNVHGIYKEEPNIQFDLIEKISYSTHAPLVLHGGTGLSDEIIKKCIEKGICKINFNTELQIAWHNSIINYIENNKSVYDPRKNISSGEIAVKDVIKHKIVILGSNDRVK